MMVLFPLILCMSKKALWEGRGILVRDEDGFEIITTIIESRHRNPSTHPSINQSIDRSIDRAPMHVQRLMYCTTASDVSASSSSKTNFSTNKKRGVFVFQYRLELWGTCVVSTVEIRPQHCVSWCPAFTTTCCHGYKVEQNHVYRNDSRSCP